MTAMLIGIGLYFLVGLVLYVALCVPAFVSVEQQP